MAFRKYYTEEQVRAAATNNTSLAGFLRELGLQPKGHNYDTGRSLVERYNLDTSHWTGQAWSRGKHLKEEGGYARAPQIKRHLVSTRGHRCESCNLETWLDKPITLELEHIDGDRTNNVYTNLKLLCPNCHAQTPTWRRQKSVVAAVGLEPTL